MEEIKATLAMFFGIVFVVVGISLMAWALFMGFIILMDFSKRVIGDQSRIESSSFARPDCVYYLNR